MRYDYICNSCNSEFIGEHGMMETQKECVKCHSEDIKKIFKNMSFVLKGNNWEKKDGY